MFRHSQFRKVLPFLQTVIAISFGGWGLWIRNSILSRTYLGGSTVWDSTLRFHVWPWPLKFAAILNLPALLAGAVVSLPLGYFRTRFSGWAWTIPTVICVSLLWYWLGRRVDKSGTSRSIREASFELRVWVVLLLFMLICATAASSHTIWGLFGIGIWLLVGMAIWILGSRKAKRA